MPNFHHIGIFSMQFWMFITINSFHQTWIFITLINFNCSEKFITNLNFHQLMNFHQNFELSSWLWGLVEIMNYHKDLYSLLSLIYNYQFSIQWLLFLKMMNLIKLVIFHQNRKFSSQSWIFIIIMIFFQNDDLSPHGLSSVKTINLYQPDEFHNFDEFSS